MASDHQQRFSNIAVHVPPGWRLPERMATPEEVHLSRRRILNMMGMGAMATLGGGLVSSCQAQRLPSGVNPQTAWAASEEALTGGGIYPAMRNDAYPVGRDITSAEIAGAYNNFYEFTTNKERVWIEARDFEARPWQVEVTGLVNRPRTYDIDELERAFPLEERVYRFRCVEAWSMVIPWTGFPLRRLLAEAEPTGAATHVRFISVNRPEQMRGQRTQTHYPWPYYEGLSLAEAMNDLTLLTTGVYGHRLPPQHGAPVRIVVPWKYGYKSPKSIVRIEVTDERPSTFWNDLAPDEYSFSSNVNPEVPHPRWSQATERVVETGERIPTQLHNGYAEWVGELYG